MDDLILLPDMGLFLYQAIALIIHAIIWNIDTAFQSTGKTLAAAIAAGMAIYLPGFPGMLFQGFIGFLQVLALFK